MKKLFSFAVVLLLTVSAFANPVVAHDTKSVICENSAGDNIVFLTYTVLVEYLIDGIYQGTYIVTYHYFGSVPIIDTITPYVLNVPSQQFTFPPRTHNRISVSDGATAEESISTFVKDNTKGWEEEFPLDDPGDPL